MYTELPKKHILRKIYRKFKKHLCGNTFEKNFSNVLDWYYRYIANIVNIEKVGFPKGKNLKKKFVKRNPFIKKCLYPFVESCFFSFFFSPFIDYLFGQQLFWEKPLLIAYVI